MEETKKYTRQALNKIAAAVDTKELTVREELLHKQLATKKLVTSVTEKALLVFKDKLEYGKDDQGDPTTVVCKYKDVNKGVYYSVSLKDILNKLTLSGTDNTIAAELEKDWMLPAVIYIDSVVKEDEDKQSYPITMFKGYTRDLFQKEGEELSRAIDAVRKTDKQAWAEPFYKSIDVITKITDVPLG